MNILHCASTFTWWYQRVNFSILFAKADSTNYTFKFGLFVKSFLLCLLLFPLLLLLSSDLLLKFSHQFTIALVLWAFRHWWFLEVELLLMLFSPSFLIPAWWIEVEILGFIIDAFHWFLFSLWLALIFIWIYSCASLSLFVKFWFVSSFHGVIKERCCCSSVVR